MVDLGSVCRSNPIKQYFALYEINPHTYCQGLQADILFKYLVDMVEV